MKAFVLLNIFAEIVKKLHLFEIELFCNNINGVSVFLSFECVLVEKNYFL